MSCTDRCRVADRSTCERGDRYSFAVLEIAWTATTSAVAAGFVAFVVASLQETSSNARRHRRLEQLELAMRLRRDVADQRDLQTVLDRTIDDLTTALSTSLRRQPVWRSVFQYLGGLVIVIVPIVALYFLAFPEMRKYPIALIPVAVSAAIIYAIESQPLFLRPVVGRFARGRRSPTWARQQQLRSESPAVHQQPRT